MKDLRFTVDRFQRLFDFVNTLNLPENEKQLLREAIHDFGLGCIAMTGSREFYETVTPFVIGEK